MAAYSHGGRCRISPSTIIGAGNGVFATRNYAEGGYVGFYDGIIIDNTSASAVAPEYRWRLSEGTYVLGAPARRLVSSVGHLMNDGATLCITRHNPGGEEVIADDVVVDKLISDYEQRSMALANCAPRSTRDQKDPRRLYATRAIKCGEELFLHYGAEHWLYKAMYYSTSATDRIMYRYHLDRISRD